MSAIVALNNENYGVTCVADPADDADKAIAAAKQRLTDIAAGKSTVPDIYTAGQRG